MNNKVKLLVLENYYKIFVLIVYWIVFITIFICPAETKCLNKLKSPVLTNSESKYNLCLRYYREKNYDDAIKSFNEYLHEFPENSFAYQKFLNLLRDAGKSEEAKSFIEDLIIKYPKNVYPQWALGIIYTKSGENEKALELFKKTINQKPEFAQAYVDLANLYRSIKKLQSGVSFFEQLLKAQRDNPALYYGLAYIYKLKSQWEKALVNLKKTIELRPDFLDAYILQMKVLRNSGQYKQAITTGEQALSFAIKKGDIEAQGKIKSEFANNYWYLGNTGAAQKNAEEALEIFQKTVNKSGELSALNICGLAFRTLGKLDKALEVFNKNLEIDRELNDLYGEETDLGSIGDIYTELGEYGTALQYYQQALQITIEIDNKIDEAINLGAISTVYAYQGDYEKSMDYSKRAIKIHRETGYKSGECNDLGNLGLTYMELGEYSKSVTYQNQALEVAFEIDEKYKIHTGLGNLGSLYLLIGDYQKALDYTKRAKKTAVEMNDILYSAIWMSQMAAIQMELGNLTESLAQFNISLSTFKKIGDQRNEALTYSNIANIKFKFKNYTDSEKYYKKALEINQKINNRYSLGQTYINLAGFYVETQDLKEGLQSYKEGLKIGEKLKIPEIIWKANYGIGLIYQKSGKNSKAKDYFKKAIQVFEKIRYNIISGEQKSYFFENKIKVYNDLVGLLFKDFQNNRDIRILEESFYYAEQAKARTLLDIIFESNIKLRKGINPKLIAQQNQIYRNISKLRTDLLKNDISESQQQKLYSHFKKEEENLDNLQVQLKRENPAYANLNYPEPARIVEIQKSIIDNNDLLLEYSLADPSSFLWAITKDKSYFFKLPGEKDIQKNVNKYLSIISKPPSAINASAASGKNLYNLLLKPVQSILKQSKNLMIIPDGILHYFPFETLIMESDKNQPVYLAEEYNIRYAPSASVMMVIKENNLKSKFNPEMELVAFGDPVFDEKSEVKEVDKDENRKTYNDTERGLYEHTGFNFQRLPYTALEVNNISSFFKKEKVSVNLREYASEEKFKALNPINSRIMHFASHGLMDEEYPQRSCIVLTLDDDPAEDGFLQMNEIFNLDLNTDIVVLSACQTGRGKLLQGEGVIGLTRAFLYAGARSVLVSLWTVNDRSTSEIMSKFYQYLHQNHSIDEALRKAKNDLLKGNVASLRHPYYWAPFIFIGNSN